MIIIAKLEEKLIKIFGKPLIDNYGIFLVLSGVHNNSWAVTLLSFSLWTYYLILYLRTAHHALYVDRELSSEAVHYAVTIVVSIGYFVAYRLMAARIKDFLRYLEEESFVYGDTLDPETQKEICNINATTKKRKLAARYVTVVYAFFTLTYGVIVPVLSGRLWLEEDDEHLTRNALLVKYSLFDAGSGIGWFVALLLDTSLIFMFFFLITAVDAPFICFAEETCKTLDILNNTIRNVFRRAEYVFKLKYELEIDSYQSTEFGDCLTECMKESVKHHVVAITCCRKLSAAYTLPVFVVFFFGAIILCDSIMSISSNRHDLGMILILFTNMVGDLSHGLMYAYYGERLLQANLDLHREVYLIGWENSTKALKPYLNIMQAYTIRIAIKLSALGFFDYNFISFKNIVSSGYSYFNLLSASSRDT